MGEIHGVLMLPERRYGAGGAGGRVDKAYFILMRGKSCIMRRQRQEIRDDHFLSLTVIRWLRGRVRVARHCHETESSQRTSLPCKYVNVRVDGEREKTMINRWARSKAKEGGAIKEEIRAVVFLPGGANPRDREKENEVGSSRRGGER